MGAAQAAVHAGRDPSGRNRPDKTDRTRLRKPDLVPETGGEHQGWGSGRDETSWQGGDTRGESPYPKQTAKGQVLRSSQAWPLCSALRKLLFRLGQERRAVRLFFNLRLLGRPDLATRFGWPAPAQGRAAPRAGDGQRLWVVIGRAHAQDVAAAAAHHP